MSIARGISAQTDPVLRRLSVFRPISEAAAAAVDRTLREHVLRVDAGQDVIVEGARTDRIRMVLSGWLARYKTLEDGRREIVNFILPGDSCDAFAYLLSRQDHSICALAGVIYSEIERDRFEALIASDHLLAEALWCEALIECAIQR